MDAQRVSDVETQLAEVLTHFKIDRITQQVEVHCEQGNQDNKANALQGDFQKPVRVKA